MSALNVILAREYFEAAGYLVTQPTKHGVPGRAKLAEEKADLVICNTRISEHRTPAKLVWETKDLKNVARAVVGVRGWHTGRFYVSRLKRSPDIVEFAEADAVGYAAGILGSRSMAKILCIPKLPASGELKNKAIEFLKSKGIDGIVTFRTMLGDLISRAKTNRNYEKSDLMQVIRLLKTYDFLKDPQMDFFEKKRRKEKER
ncbi:MAG: hypothetical protein R6V03_01305 [Kiritimatiellia bacterium]